MSPGKLQWVYAQVGKKRIKKIKNKNKNDRVCIFDQVTVLVWHNSYGQSKEPV